MVGKSPNVVKSEGSAKEGSTKLSKCIGWLNNNLLATPMTYSEVIEPLKALGDAEATKLLKELETKASSIKDPTNWLVKAAARIAGGESTTRAVSGGKSGGKSGGWGDQWGAAASKKIGRTIGWMNHNSGLMEPITYSEVAPALASLGDTEACKILKDLSEKAATVKSPTNWLLVAAKKRGGAAATASGFSGASGFGGAGGESKKISRTIGWMNHNSGLMEPITFAEVAPALQMLGDKEACALLKDLSEKAATIKSPTNWLLTAAKKKMGGW